MPLRDDRRGRRASVDGDTPLLPRFEPTASPKEPTPSTPSDLLSLVAAVLRPRLAAAKQKLLERESGSGDIVSPVPQPEHGPEAAGDGDTVEPQEASNGAGGWWYTEERSFAAELDALVHEQAFEGDVTGRVELDDAFIAAAQGEQDGTAAPSETLGSTTGTAVGGAELVPSTTASGPGEELQVVEPLVIHRRAATAERIVPLTRLPLRPQSMAIVWPRLAGREHELGVEERHALLRDMATRPPAIHLQAALEQAYREEGTEGRILVLRGLIRGRYDARDTFIDALRTGTDDERWLAVDALLALGLRDPLVTAFSDRVEAIAAKAALGCAGSNRREDCHAVLAAHVDNVRCDALLSLLAGVLT